MIKHYSFRVPWHDNGWNGTICRDPAHNLSCLRLKNILENRDDNFEINNCGKCMKTHEELLNCIQESSAFMSDKELIIKEIHPYKENNPETHGHFLETEVRFPPYSFSARPFNWLLEKNIKDKTKYYGIEYDASSEPVLPFDNAWIQDAKNHRAVFDNFYEDVKPNESLCVVYAKQVPFIDEPRRVIIGLGHITKVVAAEEHKHTNDKPLRSMTWETRVCHSIRNDNADGFIIPYSEMMKYAEDHPEFDIKSITVFAPDDAFEEFSYATEQVSYDAMIEVVESCIKSFSVISECLQKDYSNIISWLKERLSELWIQRGAFPGLGSMLCSLGINKGLLIEKEIKDKNINDDLWEIVEKMFDDPRSVLSKELAKEIPLVYQASWNNLGDRKTLFKLLCRFSLNIKQAISIFNVEERDKSRLNFSDKEIVENPYILYERTRLKEGTSNSELYFSIKKVDRALFPAKEIIAKYPMEKPSALLSDNDQRRVRAIAISVLENEAKKGNTILPCSLLTEKMKDIIVNPECIVTSDILNGIQKYLSEEIIRREMKDGTDYYKLVRINKFDSLIETKVKKRINAGKLQITGDWKKLVNTILGPLDNDEDEERAREEKAAILEEIAKSRISVLIGGAGTGKTTLLSILCSHPEIKNGGVLLLAPTGKATVRLKESMKLIEGNYKALNVAQFLTQSKRFNWYEMRYDLLGRSDDGDIPQTVIIDESSMLTEEMFGALLEALAKAKRIIFVGDPHQLPPIGAGRPFVDLVNLLKINLKNNFPKVCDNYGELTINRRQKGNNIRLDVELSKQFNGEETELDDEDVITSIIDGKSNNIHFVKWDDKTNLEKLVFDISSKTLKMKNADDIEGFNRALGANEKDGYFYFNKGAAAYIDRWQILAPTKNKPHGILNINRLFHEKYRSDFINLAKQKYRKIPKPFGNDGIVYGDKVINVINTKVDAYPKENATNYIANGEVGIVVDCFGKAKDYFKVEFSSQQGVTYSLNPNSYGGSDDRESNLELAYALTIHKAQGSQFKSVLLVLGEPCSLMSRELIYTALTRQEDNITILYNEDPFSLLKYSSDRYSEISKRYTDLFAEIFKDKGIDYRPNIVEANGDFYEEKLIHRTRRGELVRSKSEVIIADCLYSNNLEYEYEPVLEIEGKIKRPDFKIVDYDTDEIVYLEHCGMMGNVKYRKRWEEKKKFYEKNGIIEGKNLIVTYDKLDGSIDSKEIDDLIKKTFNL